MLPPVAPQTSTPTAAISEVDVASKLEALASQQGEQLNWCTSIVDLLKLLNIDSSLAARKHLAAELHYTGSTDDSAAMNICTYRRCKVEKKHCTLMESLIIGALTISSSLFR